MLAGVLMLVVWALRMDSLISLLPLPVMVGFCNGLAIVMTRAQLTHFRSPLTGAWLSGAPALSRDAVREPPPSEAPAAYSCEPSDENEPRRRRAGSTAVAPLRLPPLPVDRRRAEAA